MGDADAARVFRMPSLGADMDEGTVLEWLVRPGDRVHRGDLVAVVKTDKADIEVEVFDDGTIGELLVPVGTKVAVGTPGISTGYWKARNRPSRARSSGSSSSRSWPR